MTSTLPEAGTRAPAAQPEPRRLLEWAAATFRDHPVLVTLVVATIVRLAVAVVSFMVNQPLLLPDEGNYLSLSTWVESGRDADGWQPGYGQFLYDSTWAFVSPIVALFHVFGPSRLIGQLVAVAAGVGAAGLTSCLGDRLGGRRVGLVAGLVVALLPSQILFSSVAIRESMVWLGLVLVAVGLLAVVSEARWGLPGGLAMIVGGLWLVGMLRDHTAVAAAWALALAALVLPARRRIVFVPAALAAAVFVPALTGAGPFGWSLVDKATSSLAQTRATFALEAESGFTTPRRVDEEGPPTGEDPMVAAPTTSVPPDAQPSSAEPPPGARIPTGRPYPTRPGASSTSLQPTTTLSIPPPYYGPRIDLIDPPPPRPEPEVVEDVAGRAILEAFGERYELEPETLSTNMRHVPEGLVAVLIRPLPWDRATSISSQLAIVENVAWLALYVLAAIGVFHKRRSWRLLVFPIALGGVIIGIGALTEGNLGSAFRHRGQITWALAALAAIGSVRLFDVWTANRLRRA